MHRREARRLTLRSSRIAGFLLAAALGLAGVPPAGAISILKSFSAGGADGLWPQAPLIGDGAGNLYGTTQSSGTGGGTVFTIKTDGTGFTVLHNFLGWPSDGAEPLAGLVLDGRGNLYGTTQRGGAYDSGTVFKLRTDGTGFALLNSFGGSYSGGLYPEAGLVLDGAGVLYGTTYGGGAPAGGGTVFRVNTDGTGFSVLHSFGSAANGNANPTAGLVLDGAGNLYGTTYLGGSSNQGAVFTIRTDGGGFSLLHSFAGSDGAWPFGGLVLDGAGNLYGTTVSGGASGGGTVYTLRTSGSGFASLHSFLSYYAGVTDAASPNASLILDGAGNLYGTTELGGTAGDGTVFSIKTDGSDFAILHTFAGGASDGRWPQAALEIDGAGNLHGTTYYGGASDGGTVFTLGTDGSGFAVQHSFSGTPPEGSNPNAGLALDGSGNVYGTTEYGGAKGAGTAFKLETDGSDFAVLHTFWDDAYDGGNPVGSLTLLGGALYGTARSGGAASLGAIFSVGTNGGAGIVHSFAGLDGSSPTGGLVLDGAENVYGTTQGGGASDAGTVFTLSPFTNHFAVLHSFAGGASDGAGPSGGVILDRAGTLYGTTAGGGASGTGTIFTLQPDGTGPAVLHSFAGGGSDGASPFGALTLVDADTLVGTATAGGASNKGTVFSIKTDGTGFTVMHSFAGGPSDGAGPYSGMLQLGADTLVGTTTAGGASDNGTVYTIKTDGSGFTLLHSFAGGPSDGARPYGGLADDGAGNLYGTTASGGEANLGTVFSLPVPASAGEPSAFTSAPSAGFGVGVAGTFTVTTTGYPTPGIAASGALPTGVGFADNRNGTATLSGTPAAGTAGTYPLTFTAHNGVGADAVQQFTLTVSALTIVTTSPLPAAVVGKIYSASFWAVGGSGDYTWSMVSGSLDGLSLSANGLLDGTPAAIGDFSFTVQVTDGASHTAQGDFALHVDPSYSNLVWVPVASHNAGANQSQWRSDLGLLNTGAATANVKLTFHGYTGTVSTTISVATGAQSILTDVVGQVGGSGSGAIEVLSDQPLSVTARSYNLVSSTASCYPGGTQGQDYPALVADSGLSAGQSAYLAGLTENAAYRCNVGLIDIGDNGATVLVELFDGTGAKLSDYTVSLGVGQWAQEIQPFNSKAGQTAMDRGYAKITVTSGSGVFGFASVIDNLTNDPTTVAMGDAAEVTIREYPAGTTAGTEPFAITAGPDGALWFTQQYGDLRIGRITTAGVVTAYSAGSLPFSAPNGITTGPDGALWFAEGYGHVSRITTAGVLTEYAAGITPGAGPFRITRGPDDALWFTEYSGNRIGRITTDGAVTEYSAGITAGVYDITAGPDGALWFTENGGNRIGRITTAGVVTEYSAGLTGGTNGIAAGSDGALWFTESGGDRIGRITTDGVVTEYSAGITAGAALAEITAGPDGALWFTEYFGARIGRITTAGEVTEYSAGMTALAQPWDITAGPDGALWFTERYGNSIGRLTGAGLGSPNAFSVWVPVASHNAGANGSQWRSDLGLLNPGTVAANLQLRFFGSTGVVSTTTEVPPGAQLLLTDVVGQIGGNGSGAIEVTSDRPVNVTARSYNLVSSDATCYAGGTQGQDYPALVAGTGLQTGQSAYVPGLIENASYRSNVGLVNAGSAAATALVELFSGEGVKLTDYTVALAPGQWLQETQPFRYKARQTAMDRGYAKITVQSGSGVFGFGSVIDNITNDPTTVTMQQ
ncbi:MAG: choice-of-anchor tandem repeat GloVer-containing protein [Thermoanaerobaculaceae bacterium]|jgi:uncharacterized repeat protein (TIGR03803 family)